MEFNEQVTSALQKIKRTGSDDVLVVAPKGARILSSLTTLKLLKSHIDKVGKTVHFATADAKGAVLLRRVGFALEGKMPKELSESPRGGSRLSISMGDIVGKKKTQKAESSPSKPVKIRQQESKKMQERELSHLIGPQDAGGKDFSVPGHTKPKFPHYTKYIVSAAGAFLIILVLVLFVLPRAEITVTSRSESISRDLEMLVDSRAENVNSQDLIVPGIIVEEELTESMTFTSTGKKSVGKQAAGSVRIRNFSNNSLILRKETTRLEIDGKVYRLQEDIGGLRPTGRTGTGENDPVDESTLTAAVPIIADQPGVEYNVSQGTRFEVINEVFGHQPEILFAVNDSAPVSGGTDEFVDIVAEEDIVGARQAVNDGIIERLAKTMSADQRITKNGVVIEVLEEALSHPVGTEAGQFQLTIAAKARALAFNETQVESVIADRIIRLLPENKHLVQSETQDLEATYVSLDLGTGAGTLRATYRSIIQYTVNREFLQNGLRGKKETEVKEILLSRPEVQSVEIKLWPFWVKSVPAIGGKVEFKVVE